MKVAAFSIQGALIIMIFSSITIGSLILLNKLNNSLYNNTYLQSLLLTDIQSATILAMGSTNNKEIEDSTILNHTSYVKYKRINWGLFDIVCTSGKYGNIHQTRVGLYSVCRNKENIPTLYIKSGLSSLSLAGNSSIKGDIYCPNKQIKRAYIEGKPFNGDKLFDGKIFNVKEKDIEFDFEIINTRIQTLNKKTVASHKIPISALDDSLTNEFSNQTICIYSENSILINNSIKGNIIIHSEKEILVDEGADLEHCLLSAPIILINTKNDICFQAFATKSIEINEGARINFPSCLVTTGIKESLISLENNVHLEGNILALKENMIFPETLIKLSKTSDVIGLIHTNGCIDLRGKINGGVVCQKILVKSGASVYENLILDTKLSQMQFPKLFPCSYIENEEYSFEKLVEVI